MPNIKYAASKDFHFKSSFAIQAIESISLPLLMQKDAQDIGAHADKSSLPSKLRLGTLALAKICKLATERFANTPRSTIGDVSLGIGVAFLQHVLTSVLRGNRRLQLSNRPPGCSVSLPAVVAKLAVLAECLKRSSDLNPPGRKVSLS